MSEFPPFPRARSESEERPRRKGESGRVETRWRELWTWLGSALDGFGLDAPLYARCLLSILRQSPSAFQDSEEESEEEDTVGGEVVGLGVVGGRGKATSRCSEAGREDAREAALLECLSTAELPRPALVAMVSELLRRYRELEALFTRSTSRPNDSIDSGVCPSPETTDSFQNYDEAFPPLLELGGDEFLGKPPPLPVKEKELKDPQTPNSAPNMDISYLPEPREKGASDAMGKETNWGMGWVARSGARTMSGGVVAGSVPTRLSALSSGLPFTTQWTRPGSEQRRALVSCPQMEWWGGSRSRQVSDNRGAELQSLGVQEIGGLAQLTSHPSHHHFSATPPTFVVPKFRQTQGAITSVKVGSCPSKLEFSYSGPPGAQSDLWTWLSAQTASVHPHNLAHQPPPPSPGLPDFDSSYDFPCLRTINEDPQPQLPPPIHSNQHWPRLGDHEEGRQIFPAQAQPEPMSVEAWETVDVGQLDTGNFSFGMDSQSDFYLEPPSMEEEVGVPASPPGFVVPRLAQMAGTDAIPRAQPRHHQGAGFQGIRSESMEFAFVPRHRHPSLGSYAVDFAHGEEWFVLRDHHPSSRISSRPRTRQSSASTDLGDHSGCPPKRRRPSGKSDTLPLKFKATKHAKMVQTEPEEPLSVPVYDDDVTNNNDLHRHYNNLQHWDRWRDEGREWDEVGEAESGGCQALLRRPNHSSTFSDSEGRKIVSLGAGSSIWESVPRTCVSEWGAVAAVGGRREEDTESEKADDELLLSLVGSISVNAPL